MQVCAADYALTYVTTMKLADILLLAFANSDSWFRTV
jgi:hypothetical protein